MRNKTILSTGWHFIKTAASADEAMRANGEAVTLPHTWNAVDGQDGGNDYYRGECWYTLALTAPVLPNGYRAFLEFQGAAMTAEVYLNSERLARHEGGYSTFRVDITDNLQAENILAVSVDNRDNSKVYPQKADFTFYGGLYREVSLITVPETHFALDNHGGPGLRVTPVMHGADAEVTVEALVNGPADFVSITVNGETREVPVIDRRAEAVFTLTNAHLWDGIDDPYLYTAQARLSSGDEISARFGCRSFRMDSQQGFLLNGRPYPLRGVSRHGDRAGVGNALTQEHHREDMSIVRELGANTLRLAHYQHDQYFYDLCDENGIVVWAEIPYITLHVRDGRENTLSQMRELVTQCYNHPSIVCWGLSNEITAASMVSEELLENHRALNDLCHELDATRPTVMANVFMLETDSPLLEIPDLNSYNLYFGWYVGELEQNDSFFDEYHAKYPNRCIGFSEYGADANPQFQSSKPDRGDYTEGYQALYHEHILRMIEARHWLWATHVWNLFDFAADGRDEGGKHGVNQKGLVTMDRRLKKDAFYLYKAHWSREPFVHLCGRRYVDRDEALTEIKVYSNQPEVTLYVDGKMLETQSGSRVFRFSVPLTAERSIEVSAGNCTDAMTVRRVEHPNQKYVFGQQDEIVNWFEQENYNPECFSIRDKLADLQSHPQAGAIVGRLMDGMSASRGDVAESVKDNANLQKMLGRMTLQSLFKQAGDAVTPQQIKELNAALQRIRKVD